MIIRGMLSWERRDQLEVVKLMEAGAWLVEADALRWRWASRVVSEPVLSLSWNERQSVARSIVQLSRMERTSLATVQEIS